MTKKLSIWLIVLALTLIVSDALLVMSVVLTNPKQLGPAGVTFWFMNVLLFITTFVTALMFAIRVFNPANRAQLIKVLGDSFRTGFLIGVCVTILVALSSLRSLSIRDIILFILTIVLFEIYFRTRRAQKS